jgi:hypothetical protein
MGGNRLPREKECGDGFVRQEPVAEMHSSFYLPGNAIIESAIKQVIESMRNEQSSIGKNRSSRFGTLQGKI